METLSRLCLQCQKEFKNPRATAKYCSSSCKNKVSLKKYDQMNPRNRNLPPGTVGALHELKVAADLMDRGYHVFRALSPSCPADLAILNGKELLRVEVTTGSYTRKGSVLAPVKDLTKFDILAVALHDRIEYRPDLPEKVSNG